jgi:Cu+-exporting ATPase
MTTHVDDTQQHDRDVELVIGGMTCASCAARIEKKLNKMPGVTATVNYATEKAKVSFAADVDPADLVATVEATGYTATLPTPPTTDTTSAPVDAAQHAKDEEAAAWRQRLVVSTLLTVPVLLMSMVPALQFDNWQWLSLTLASPVVVWGACRSIVPPGPTCATARPRWTHSSRSAWALPTSGRCGRCSSPTPA